MNWLRYWFKEGLNERIWEPICRRKDRLRQARTERDYWKGKLDEAEKSLIQIHHIIRNADLPILRGLKESLQTGLRFDDIGGTPSTPDPQGRSTLYRCCPDCGSDRVQTTLNECLVLDECQICRVCGWSECRLKQEA